MNDVDDLIDRLNGSEGVALQRMRGVVPDAKQGRSYGMPRSATREGPCSVWPSTKAHISLHPLSPAVIEAVAEQLSGYSLSKGTIRFTVDRPVPDVVLEQLLRLRVEEIDG